MASSIRPSGRANPSNEGTNIAMATGSVEKKALGLLTAFENAGRKVSKIVVDGRKIELVLHSAEPTDEFEGLDMRHGKT